MKRGHGLPFAIHQVCEYALGAFLIASSPQLGPHGFYVVAGAGAALIGWAAISDGFLGLGIVSRALHGALDWAVLVALVGSPFLFGLSHDIAAILVLECAALVLGCIVPVTSYERRFRPLPRPVAAPVLRAKPRPVSTVSSARMLGRVAGKARKDGPRSLGRAVGRRRNAQRPVAER